MLKSVRPLSFWPNTQTCVICWMLLKPRFQSVLRVSLCSRTANSYDQQLQRLERRWAAARPVANPVIEIIKQRPEPRKRKPRRTRDKLRLLRDKEIAEIDDIAETIGEFLQLMDEREVKPQPTWSTWPGTWLRAYKDPHLRELIHKDKSRALARTRKQRSK